MKKKSTTLIVICLLAMLFCTSSYADTYHITNANYAWFPTSTSSVKDTSGYNITSSTAYVEGVIECSNTPLTIKIVLQKLNGLGWVIGESNASYYVTYYGGYTTNERTGQQVLGKFFRVHFANLDSNGKYRVRFCDPTIVEEIGLTHVYFVSQSN